LSGIRSTIDIMMERTRGMALSSEERESLRREDMLKKAKGYKLKLLENLSVWDEVLSSLAQEPPADRALVESFLWRILVEELPSNEEILKYLDVLEAIAPGKSSTLKEMRTAFKSGAKDRISDRKKLVHKEKKRLAALGISGTAVMPKIPPDADAGDDFSAVLEKFKSQLLEASPG
jgi:hypothetical protein